MKRLFSFAPAAFVFAGMFVLSACSGGSSMTPSTLQGGAMQVADRQAAAATTETVVSQSLTTFSTGLGTPVVRWTHVQNRPGLTPNAARPQILNSPFNLTYFGGPLVKSMASHPIYVNAPAVTWGSPTRGTPGTFLNRFGKSNFIHILDQYEGATAGNRYTLGTSTQLSIPHLPHVVQLFSTTQPSILSIVHAVASHLGTGYGHEYHVFLAPGTDTCMGPSAPNVCYSPDNPATFVFCAYHGSVDFSDIHHVLFSVEPFQGVVPGLPIGCAADNANQIPHGTIDSTARVLSHELSETITDPDGTSWFNRLFLIEIGDECIGFADNDNIDGLYYFIQEEYSNALNGCTNVP